MHGGLSSSEGVPQTCTAVEASGMVSQPSVCLDKYEILKAFVEASHVRGIVSGVQVKLMLELAEELAFPSPDVTLCTANDAAPAQDIRESAPASATVAAGRDTPTEQASQSREATPVHLPLANDSCNSSMTATAVVPGTALETYSNMQQPQLHIQPLDLHSQLTPSPLSCGVATADNRHDALHLQQSLPSTSLSLSQHQASSFLGLTPAFLAAAQAAAAAHTAAPKQQSSLTSKPDSVMLAQQYTDSMVAAAGCFNHPAAAAATANYSTAPACGVRPSAARKHKFTKEQHAAILESVERNYALYPSRYTELVIKEMQTMFPGIEINNACVRKIKFRANEATKQGTTAGYLSAVAPMPHAASGALDADPFSCRDHEAAAAEAACGLVGLASAAVGAADARADVTAMGSASAAVATSSPCKADEATQAGDQGSMQQPHQQPQAMSTEAVVQQQQQPPGVSGLAAEDSFIDSATAAAAEAMHMLASCSGRTEPCSNPLKRKPEEFATTCDEGAAATAASGQMGGAEADADAPSAGQIAEALAAAAGLGSKEGAAAVQLTAGLNSSSNQPSTSDPPLQWSSTAMLQAAAAAGPQQSLSRHDSATAVPAPIAAEAAAAAPAAKRQRLSGVQMAELVASVRHHVQVNPERYTHCVIKDMKEKYPDLELNMGQIRKIKFRTLGNINPRQAAKAAQQQQPTACNPAAASAMSRPLASEAVAAAATGQLTAHTSAAAAASPLNFTWDAAKALEAVAAAAAAAASLPQLQ